MRTVIGLLKTLGAIWLLIFVVLVVASVFNEIIDLTFALLLKLISPFEAADWVLKLLLVAPAIVLLYLARLLEKKHRKSALEKISKE